MLKVFSGTRTSSTAFIARTIGSTCCISLAYLAFSSPFSSTPEFVSSTKLDPQFVQMNDVPSGDNKLNASSVEYRLPQRGHTYCDSCVCLSLPNSVVNCTIRHFTASTAVR